MRVSRETREKTREKILTAARSLFSANGFDATTTRDIAAGAGIATGTLFNYFPSKESLGMELIAGALEEGRDDYRRLKRGEEAVEEDLFLYVVTGLNRLEPHRNYLASVVETAWSPFTGSAGNEAAETARIVHLEEVADILRAGDVPGEPSFVAVHLYWTLYLGVLAFWSRDASPDQEDTLVLLDQSLRLFSASLAVNLSREEIS
jgi:AcrR family transcriptional regulator